jgi:Transposase DDE domain group 1
VHRGSESAIVLLRQRVKAMQRSSPMPTQCSRDLFGYEVVEGRQVVAAFDGGEVTSDAGALLLGATDRAIGLVTRFAACFADGRARSQIEHSVAAMVAQRVRPPPSWAALTRSGSRKPNSRPGAGSSSTLSVRPRALMALIASSDSCTTSSWTRRGKPSPRTITARSAAATSKSRSSRRSQTTTSPPACGGIRRRAGVSNMSWMASAG